MEDKLFIDRLSGPENWATWKFQMEHLLKAKGLWGMLMETETLAADANAAAQADFTRRTEKAFSMLVLNVSTPQLYLITSCQTPKEAWTTLKAHFERDTLANKLFLKKRYFRCEMKEGEALTDHLKQMKELTDQLSAIGSVIEEEDQIVTLLGSLPPSYATIVTALETKIDNLTLKFVQQALINEEQKRVNANDSSGATSGGASAMSSQFRGNVQDSSKTVGAPDRSTWRCYKCGKEGHIKRDCPTWKNKPKKKIHKAKHMMCEDEEDSSESAFVIRDTNSDRPQQGEWLIDSGASKHMTCDKEKIQEYQEFTKSQSVKLGDGRVVDALGIGNVKLKMTFKLSDVKNVTMYDVLYVPKLSGNLFSVGAATKRGNTVQFRKSRCYIRGKSGTLQGMGTQRADGLYQLDIEGSETVCHSASVAASLWHQRLGHTTRLKELKDLVNGVNFSAEKEIPFCEGCVEGKLARKPFKPIGGIRSKRKMQLIHSDVCGPMQTESISGAKYFVTFIDDYTRCCKVYFMKQKNEVLSKFKEFERTFSNESGLSVTRLRTDNGGEYTSKEFQEYLKSQGIHHEMTVPHSPQQNGVAERKNRTLVEAARSMLSHAKLPKMFWAEAVATAAYIQNRLPTAVLKEETPYERWCGKKPDMSHMKVFGCIAYAHIPDEERRKLDKKAVKLRFVGYANNAKGYRMYDEEKRRILIRRDVIFDESNFSWKQEMKETCSENEITIKTDESETQHEVTADSTVRTSGRIRHAPRRFGYDEFADIVTVDHYANMCRVTEPITLKEALVSPNAKEWQEAADLEYESLLENETWDLVDLPRERKAVGSRWVFRVKHHSDGRVERYKCRLVAKGYSQLYGADYDETFSPVVRFSSIRTLLSFAIQNNLHVHQMDVVTAFLNGHLEEEIYMEQPEGYIKPGQEHLVCKLKKSIYGLKQSPRCWSKAFTEFMMEIGFKQSTSDPCVFVRSRKELEILAVYVDDLILITESTESMNELKVALKERYKMKDMGELSYILGISVIQDKKKNRVILHQKHYIEAILKKYGMDNANPVATPADANVKLIKSDGVSKPVDQQAYQSMVGSLLYAAMATRPDIAQAVSAVSKFNANPDAAHLTAVKRILRYLKGTVNFALKYEQSDSGALIGFSDADWAGDQDDRRSTTGNVFLLNGGAVSWLSKKQATVALSTAEAEYIALSQAAQEGIWLKRLLSDLGVEAMSTLILEDNQGAIAIAKNPVNHSRTKHIDIRYHYIRECVQNGQIELQYCPTNDMKADIFTKPLPRQKFEYFRGEIGLFPI